MISVPAPVAPVASDVTMRMQIERWLTDKGYLISHGLGSARQERGDKLLARSEVAASPVSGERE